MKKLLILSAILLASIALIGPKLAGNTFNQGLDDYITSVNETGIYQASMVNREQNWFSTVANIRVVLMNLQGLSNDPATTEWEVNLQAQAQHGPILSNSGISLGWLDWAITLIVDELPPSLKVQEEGPVYQALGQMGVFGGTSYKDRISAMTYTDETIGVTVSTEGWQGSAYLSDSSVRYQGGPGNFVMSLPNIYTVELDDLEMSFNAQTSITDLLKGNFYDGMMLIALKQISIENVVGNTNTQLANLLFESIIDFDENAGLADTTLEVTLANLSTVDVTLTDLLMVAEINNMQQAFFKAYKKMNNDIMQSPQQAQAIMQKAMQTHLLGQLQAEPELNISKLSGVLNGGNLNMTSSNQLVGINSLPDTMENNDFWIKHMHSTTEIRVDESAAKFIARMVIKEQLTANPQISEMDPAELEKVIAQQSEITLNSLIGQGLSTKTPSGYSMSFIMKDGKATLNNSAIPLPM